MISYFLVKEWEESIELQFRLLDGNPRSISYPVAQTQEHHQSTQAPISSSENGENLS